MIVYILRHGTASHLLEDYGRKMTGEEFSLLLTEWIKASLTEVGKEEVKEKVEQLKDNYTHLFYSPLKRTKQSAKLFLEHPDILTTQEMPALSEIFILPPLFSKKVKLSIRMWVYLCIFKSIYSFALLGYLKEARKILEQVTLSGKDTLLVSHQARILTIVIYCFLSPHWKILQVDTNPAGLTIIRFKKTTNAKEL